MESTHNETPPSETPRVRIPLQLPVKLTGVKEGRGKPYGADVWAKVRAAYEAGEIATEIAPRYGMAPGTIYTRASKESWTRTKVPSRRKSCSTP